MTDMKYLADALAYHTKGRSAVLEQTELQEKKCSCCDADPCNCDDDCGCKKSVSEGQDLKNDKNGNGIDDKDESEAKDNVVKKTNAKADKKPVEEADKGSWSKDSGWKPKDGPTKDKFGNTIKDKNLAKSMAKDAAKTSSGMDEAAKPITFGPNSNVKARNKQSMQTPDKDKNRARFGQDNIQKKKSDAEKKGASTGYKPDKLKAAEIHRLNGNEARAKELESDHRKDQMRAANEKLKKKEALKKAAEYQASQKTTKEDVQDELLGHALDLHEMIQDLNAMFIEQDLSLTEAFQAAAMTDDEIEEGFSTMSKVKQAMARKKAGRKKKLAPGYKMGRNKPLGKASLNRNA